MKNIYQGRRIDTSDETIETWVIMFNDYSKMDVIGALKRLVKKSKYVPSIHEIVKNIEDTFTVEKMKRKDVLIVRVKYRDQIIPFTFHDNNSAKDVIEYLKGFPSREDIMLLHEKNVRENNPHTTSLRVDQSDRDEFEAKKRNEYYSRRLRQ